eukprot:TRINITY_DN15246_c0_g1_i1.p1 TRINITY_DN15246_c0_g1~~TRINITY_DN15246_c0_g1_i1.p1  ORF type:complete len:141 (+),score=20.52 TRINITY_DN15246_c0_g1_i1:317-739(+)
MMQEKKTSDKDEFEMIFPAADCHLLQDEMCLSKSIESARATCSTTLLMPLIVATPYPSFTDDGSRMDATSQTFIREFVIYTYAVPTSCPFRGSSKTALTTQADLTLLNTTRAAPFQHRGDRGRKGNPYFHFLFPLSYAER